MTDAPKVKTCTTCQRELPTSSFRFYPPDRGSTIRPSCKECEKAARSKPCPNDCGRMTQRSMCKPCANKEKGNGWKSARNRAEQDRKQDLHELRVENRRPSLRIGEEEYTLLAQCGGGGPCNKGIGVFVDGKCQLCHGCHKAILIGGRCFECATGRKRKVLRAEELEDVAA